MILTSVHNIEDKLEKMKCLHYLYIVYDGREELIEHVQTL